MLLLVEQCLNGLQFGLLLFLLAAGLTLVFGIMDLVNLAHGSLYMMGAYFAATFVAWTGNFFAGAFLALAATLLLGIVLEMLALRPLYGRDHLDHVLGTFGLILFFNELVRLVWGPAGLSLPVPSALNTAVDIFGIYYPAYRLLIILVSLLVALFLYVVVMRTRLGMLIRAGASNREMAGAMAGPILSVQSGMGEPVLITTLVVIVIGGIGSVGGAFYAALIVGLVDTLGRAFLPVLLRQVAERSIADAAGPALASMSVYLLMAVVLACRPQGLFPAKRG